MARRYVVFAVIIALAMLALAMMARGTFAQPAPFTWVLTMFMYNPCCSLSMTQWRSETECQQAWKAVANAIKSSEPHYKGFTVDCSEIMEKKSEKKE